MFRKTRHTKNRGGGPLVAALGAALAALLLMAGSGAARAQDPHADDLLFGRSENPGATGTGVAFSQAGGDPTYTANWFLQPHTMMPNVNGPTAAGKIFFDLGTNVVTAIYNSTPPARAVLAAATLRALSVDGGLEIFYSDSKIFAPAGTPTVLGNRLDYPASTGTWHNHYQVRAWRPGTYVATFRITDAVARADQPALATTASANYTVTFRSQPVLTGTINLPGWRRVDNSTYKIQNLARVFVFAAGSAPTRESQALATTDVYLLPNGQFQIPEGLVADGSYRVGVKPLTAPGLARLLPGNVTFSVTAPPTLAGVNCPIGDVNRDGFIDDSDYNEVINRLDQPRGTSGTAADADVNGDGFVDDADYNEVINRLDQSGNFTP